MKSSKGSPIGTSTRCVSRNNSNNSKLRNNFDFKFTEYTNFYDFDNIIGNFKIKAF